MTSAAAVIGERAWASARLVWGAAPMARLRGGLSAAIGLMALVAFASYSAADPSWNTAASAAPNNLLGGFGAVLADVALQTLGLGAWPAALFMVLFGLRRAADPDPARSRPAHARRVAAAAAGVVLLAAALGVLAPPAAWPLNVGLGGLLGGALAGGLNQLIGFLGAPGAPVISGLVFAAAAAVALIYALSLKADDFRAAAGWIGQARARAAAPAAPAKRARRTAARKPRALDMPLDDDGEAIVPVAPIAPTSAPKVADPKPLRASGRESRENQHAFDFAKSGGLPLPHLGILEKPKPRTNSIDEASLRQNARMLESVLAEFGVRGTIDQIRPGPVVTLYELSPAPGVKHARVVALSDDIARSMSARACRVSVVSGRNAIGIELPNAQRETVYLRDLLSSPEFEKKGGPVLPMALGETIGGDPYVADLARMPHLLIAGTTGSGKSVGV
ncbi:MAG TPA: DNA translocase FtsK 4TM domain-containing protein, partial [Caulobacteraceae bacterium]